MSVETLISVEEYLSTSYDPDVEYVDGVLVERNAGDWLHTTVQFNSRFALGRKYPHVYVRPNSGPRRGRPDIVFPIFA